ncbi:MAG: hypothetical protein ACPG52_05095 [Cognaticolwellia sp.]
MPSTDNAIGLEMELMSTNLFCEKLLSIIEKKEPFSFIRLGDGEGALLQFSGDSTFFDVQYLSEHFGLDCTLKETLEVKKILRETILNSDIVGVRSDVVNVNFSSGNIENSEIFLNDFKNSFHLRNVDKSICYADARRISMLHKSVAEINFNQATEFVCASIGWDAYPSGALSYIFSQQNKIGIISSRKGLDRVISNALGVDVIQYAIPDKFELVQDYNTRHYPSVYKKLIENIKVEFPGMVFIVAGGIVGKGYCHEIKKKGGIALDLGAVVDAWVGKLSRPSPLKERYELKKSWKIKMRRKIIPTLHKTFDLPNELTMTKENVQMLNKRWLSKK